MAFTIRIFSANLYCILAFKRFAKTANWHFQPESIMYFHSQAVCDDSELALPARLYSVFCFQSVREDSDFALQRDIIVYFGFRAVGDDSEFA